MKVKSLTPVIATVKLAASKEFYEKLGFSVIFENDWYVQLRFGGERPIDVVFVMPNHETQPPIFQPAYCGKGTIFTIEVEDVKEEYDRMRGLGMKIAQELCDQPWGERHFAAIDPNDVPVNISQLIEPSKEYLQYFR